MGRNFGDPSWVISPPIHKDQMKISNICQETKLDQITFQQLEKFKESFNINLENSFHKIGSLSRTKYEDSSNLSSWTIQKRRLNLESENITQQVKIPKLIFQTWKDNEIPNHWKESPKSIKDHMKDWTYILMTDDDNLEFCRKYFPDFLPYYENFPHAIQRADAIRYMFLYIYGGLYMDLDIVVVKPLDPLFYHESDLYLCPSGNVGSCLTNSFMASKPGCKFWLKMIEHMKKPISWWMMGKHMTVMNSTGPLALDYVAKKEGYSYLALPSKDVMPCSVCNITHCKIGNAYLKPLIGSSWISWDTRFLNFFLCNWRVVIIAIIVIVILIIIYLIIRYYQLTGQYYYR
uniref:Glycosyltransferase n=1 Tax=Pithovirus LCPAC201 TaxID=2506591 RepID=A0A481Z4L3_9VIRU|nr:MAG: glycosyltransferase [Pithovirus LCPAC201]